jgi:hypothetical protein
MATLLPPMRQWDMARLQLTTGSEFKLRNTIDPTEHVLSRVGEQMENLDDVLGSFETSYFINVVLGNHSALTFLGGVGICGTLWRNWIRSIWIRVSTWRHPSRLTGSWHVWVLSIESYTIRCVKWCFDSSLSLHTSCD